jgi:hypothetical protein
VMKFEEEMNSGNAIQWDNTVNKEHDQFVKHKVRKAVLMRDILAAAKILTSTWAMKKKSNGTYRARMNARGFEQVDRRHYDRHDITAPVTNDITI